MIPPGTPPGTELVVVWDSDRIEDYLRLIRPEWRARALELWAGRPVGIGVPVGTRATLTAVHPYEQTLCGYVVETSISGTLSPYTLHHPIHYGRASLPSELTGLLETSRLPAGLEVPEDA